MLLKRFFTTWRLFFLPVRNWPFFTINTNFTKHERSKEKDWNYLEWLLTALQSSIYSMKMEQGIEGSPVILSHFQLVPAGLELWLHKPGRRLKCGFCWNGSPGMCLTLNLIYGFTSLWENLFSHDGSKILLNLLNVSTHGADKAARTLTLIIMCFPLLLFLVPLMWFFQPFKMCHFQPLTWLYQNEGKYLQKFQWLIPWMQRGLDAAWECLKVI